MTNFKDKNILIVDDEPMVLRSFERICESFFKNVKTAMDGQEALEVLSETEYSFDIVITDIQMPIMNGVELVDNMGHLYPNVPVIIVSGNLELDLSELKESRENICGVICKPMVIPSLFKILEDLFKGD